MTYTAQNMIVSISCRKDCEGVKSICIDSEQGQRLFMPVEAFTKIFGRFHMPTLDENFDDYVNSETVTHITII